MANHYRAIADLCVWEIELRRDTPLIMSPDKINDWIDIQPQIDVLVNDYLKPTRAQLDKTCRRVFDEWIPGVVSDTTEYIVWEYGPDGTKVRRDDLCIFPSDGENA